MALRINNLDKYTRYSFTVQAFNNVGTGPKNVPEVVARTDEDGEHPNKVKTKADTHVQSQVLLLVQSPAQVPPPPVFSSPGHHQMISISMVFSKDLLFSIDH